MSEKILVMVITDKTLGEDERMRESVPLPTAYCLLPTAYYPSEKTSTDHYTTGPLLD